MQSEGCYPFSTLLQCGLEPRPPVGSLTELLHMPAILVNNAKHKH